VDFHENRYRIKRKSVYYREYHIRNKLNDISLKYNLQITFNNCNKIVQIFEEIDKILPLINEGRKRIININFILKILFAKMEIKGADKIPVSSSKKTISCNKMYWKQIFLLIGGKIDKIIQR